jgi:hypothetical protein
MDLHEDRPSCHHPWRRQCMLANVVFMGELFRRQLLTENIMHVCLAMMLEAEDDVDTHADDSKEANRRSSRHETLMSERMMMVPWSRALNQAMVLPFLADTWERTGHLRGANK